MTNSILFFWIIAGTLQGVITPDIVYGFPVFDYFRYWIVHLGLLITMFYATFVFNIRPKFSRRSFISKALIDQSMFVSDVIVQSLESEMEVL